ncbi:MAG: hypothetical protein WED04_03585 [Promethearchaeati archaeon SRVP18_Atabeyarchaeia-1]
MNHAEGLAAKLKTSKDLMTPIFLVVVLLALIEFLTSANVILVISLLLCALPSVRLIYGETPTVKISTMRSNGRSMVFSDEKRKRFTALSAVEIRVAQPIGSEASESSIDRSKALKTNRILAEHVGTYSIEVSNRGSIIRYVVSAEAKTASDACQKAEIAAERMLRVVRELHGEPRPGIVDGEQLRSVFFSIVGGEFESFIGASKAAVRNCGGSVEGYGFAVLTATDPLFAKLDLKKLVSMMRSSEASVTYVINVQAHRTYNENVLIDGAEHGRTWIVSPYFVVGAREVDTVDEACTKLRNDLEDTTRAGVLRIERCSSTMNRVGRILLRSRVGRKVFLSNDQLINHVFSIRVG